MKAVYPLPSQKTHRSEELLYPNLYSSLAYGVTISLDPLTFLQLTSLGIKQLQLVSVEEETQ